MNDMPRPVPSDWTPKGFELFEIGHLFSPEADAEILTLLGCGSASARQKKRVLDRAHFAAAALRMDLYYARKPTTGQVTAAVDPLKALADELASILDKLDHESRGLLEATADADKINNSRLSNETPRMRTSYVIKGETRWAVSSLGRERIGYVLRSIQDLSRWADATAGAVYQSLSRRRL